MTTYYADRIDRQAIAERIPSQWLDAPRLRALIDGILALAQRELVDPMRQLEAYGNPDTAAGVWLDRLGQLLHCPRPFIVVASSGFFTFGQPFGAPFASTTQEGLGDEGYRRLLKMCARQIYGGCDLDSLEYQARGLFPGAAYEDEVSLVRVRLNNAIADLELAAGLRGRLPRPAGVALDVVVTSS